MLISSLIILPLAGIVLLLLAFTGNNNNKSSQYHIDQTKEQNSSTNEIEIQQIKETDTKMKIFALTVTVINFLISLIL